MPQGRRPRAGERLQRLWHTDDRICCARYEQPGSE